MLLKEMLFSSTHPPPPPPSSRPPLEDVIFCSTFPKSGYVVPREEGRWIAISSLFFIGPGIYSYYKLLPYHSLMIFICSAISSNYWREPTYGWRRDMDLMYAKFIFTVFFSSGLYYIRNPSYMVISYPSAVALILSLIHI